jgi:hypothetical protein
MPQACHHDITEILLKVALNTITLTQRHAISGESGSVLKLKGSFSNQIAIRFITMSKLDTEMCNILSLMCIEHFLRNHRNIRR